VCANVHVEKWPAAKQGAHRRPSRCWERPRNPLTSSKPIADPETIERPRSRCTPEPLVGLSDSRAIRLSRSLDRDVRPRLALHREAFHLPRMPRWPGIDPFPSALAAPKPSACLRIEDRCCQNVHVHVGFVPAGLARCYKRADAVPAHVAQGHGRPGLLACCHRRLLLPPHLVGPLRLRLKI
jgi:hypothetical protein